MAADLKSRADRYNHGRKLRTRVPREVHAELHGPRNRDAVAILAESDAERVPELVPERYKRMMVDAFAFLRGAAAGGGGPPRGRARRGGGARARAGGSFLLMNFGAFNSPEDNILFDINDF